jgi:hypothetical protein
MDTLSVSLIDTINVVQNSIQGNPVIGLDYFQKILISLIAIVTTYIAFQQWKIKRQNTRMELFDKRLQVYDATIEFIGVIIAKAYPSKEDILKFEIETRNNKFLFKKDITQHLSLMRYKAKKILRYNLEIERLQRRDEHDEEKWENIFDKDDEAFSWFIGQFKIVEDKFHKYLDMSKIF